MKRLFVLIMTVACISCDNNDDETAIDVFIVKTAGVGIDCNLILIDFSERDRVRIKKITNTDGLRYQALNLDKNNFSNEGLTLKVKVRKTLNSETFPCTAAGFGYPWVTVLEAELRQ